MKKAVAISIALAASLMITGQTQASAQNEKDEIVIFKNKIDEQAITKNGGTIAKRYMSINAVSAKIPENRLDDVRKEPSVLSIEENQALTSPPESGSSSGRITAQSESGRLTQYWGSQIGLPSNKKEYGYTGKGVKVAVIDSGLETDNENVSAVKKISFVEADRTTDDFAGHGTAVSELIASSGKHGWQGVAPEVDLYALKVMGVDAKGKVSGQLSDLISAIEWCASNNIDVANISLGTSYYSDALKLATEKAHQNGTLLIAASGNYGNGAQDQKDTVAYPAKFDNVIAVGAVDDWGQATGFSSRGPKIELAAPGTEIEYWYKGKSDIAEGTSFSAPLVTGIAALHKQIHPEWTPDQIRKELDKTAFDASGKGRSIESGYGVAQVPTKTKKMLLLDEQTHLWTLRNFETAFSLEPQIVAVKDQEGAKFRITTENGDRWVQPSKKIELPLPQISKQISVDSGAKLRALPTESSAFKSASSQTATAYEQWSDEGTQWYHVKTAEGDGWVKQGDSGKNKSYFAVKNTRLYGDPCDECGQWAFLSPQPVRAISEQGDWLQIETWLGNQWIKRSDVSAGEEVEKNTERVALTKVTEFKNAPSDSAWTFGALAPQTVASFERRGEWLHIQTWLGDAWIKP